MGKFIDLAGQTFGRLTVIERGPDHVTSKGAHEIKWWCKCSCGNPDLVLISGKSMRYGHVKSCGCLNRDIGRARAKDLTGEVFGKLTAVERIGYKTRSCGAQIIQWKCRCECGRETIVPARDLKSGNTQSCGQCKFENRYEFHDGYVVGFTNTGDTFLIDTEDYERVSQRYWRKDERHGYIESFEGGVRMPLHRFVMNAKKGEMIDHINHETSDDRKENLRKVTPMQNAINRKRRSDNKSGYPGVYQKKDSTRWYANITVDKNVIRLGSFLTKEEAIDARRAAEIEYFGEYAYQTGNELVPKIDRSALKTAA